MQTQTNNGEILLILASRSLSSKEKNFCGYKFAKKLHGIPIFKFCISSQNVNFFFNNLKTNHVTICIPKSPDVVALKVLPTIYFPYKPKRHNIKFLTPITKFTVISVSSSGQALEQILPTSFRGAFGNQSSQFRPQSYFEHLQ